MTGKLFGIPLIIIVLIISIVGPLAILMVSFQSFNKTQFDNLNVRIDSLVPVEVVIPTSIVTTTPPKSKFLDVGSTADSTPTAKPKKLPTPTATLTE